MSEPPTPAGTTAGVEAPDQSGDGSPPSREQRARGGPTLSAVLPGLPQLLAGRWGVGGAALLAWSGLLAVVLRRGDVLLVAAGGALDERLAVATVVGGLVTAWAWSWSDVRRPIARRLRGESQWRLAARAFARHPSAVAALVAIGILYVLALITPVIAPYDPNLPGDLATERLVGPSPAHPLGTDHLARDVLSRLLYGARISLTIGFVAAGISVTIGTMLGAIAGFVGGLVDGVVMRLVDTVISFPRLVLVILIVALFSPSIFVVIAVLGLTLWPSTARIVRGEVLSLREREFVQAARALGYSRARIVSRHLIPSVLGPVIVAATLGIGNTIVLEAGLSFLGLGVQAPTPSWGAMVDAGRPHLTQGWWHSTFAGLAIVVTVLSFNLVGDGLRDALDPKLRR